MENFQETMQLVVAVLTLLGAGLGAAVYIGRVLGAVTESVRGLKDDMQEVKNAVTARADKIDLEMRDIRDRVARLEGAVRDFLNR